MKKIRYAVIGTTGVGELHVKFAMRNEHVELVALADINGEAVREQADRLGVRPFTDYRKMIREEAVDAVSICTPHNLHASMATESLDAGIHTFIEKPLALSFADGKRLVDLARHKSLHICVGHQYRVHRTSRTMKKILRSGDIGRVMRLLWTWHAFRNHRYFSAAPWRGSWSGAGGGVLAHTASHELDLITWLLGRVKRVSALLTDQLHTAGLDDSLCANLLFESGAAGTLQTSINERDRYSVRQITGDRGMLVIENYRSHAFDHKDVVLLGRYNGPLTGALHSERSSIHQPEISWGRPPLVGDQPAWIKQLQKIGMWKPRLHGTEVLMESFIRAVGGEGTPLVSGESALHTVELMNAIVLSHIRRRDVELPLDPEECAPLFEELGKRGGALLKPGENVRT